MSESKRTHFFKNIVDHSSHRLLGLSFIPLHFAIWNSSNTALSNTLFLLHIGIFLFWQPFLSHKTQVRTRPTIILLLVVFGIIYLGGSWAQTIWIVFLIGILSSYRFSSLSEKSIYFAAIIFLLMELYSGLMPKNIHAESQLDLEINFISYINLAFCLLIIIPPVKTLSLRNYSSDILYSIIAVSIVVLIAMTTAIWMFYGSYDYYTSLILAFMTLGAVIIAFNMAFRSTAEFGLLDQLRDRYLLNLGTPFEDFLDSIAKISQSTQNPEEFLTHSFKELSKLDWISGFNWQTAGTTQEFGDESKFKVEFKLDDVKVHLYSNHELGPSMRHHSRLLMNIVTIFYESKQREIDLSQRAHMQAIHETGARLTHDIKNLIQSLTLMLSTANTDPQSSRGDELFTRNLSTITQRLQKTLVKLRNPEIQSEHSALLSEWSEKLQERLKQNNVEFSSNISTDISIPEEVFDNVIENLLDNALIKRQHNPEVVISANLQSNDSTLILDVKDTGSAAPKTVVEKLFNGPITSSSGFGIGLYHAASQAKSHGYKLELIENEEGNVHFQLSKIQN